MFSAIQLGSTRLSLFDLYNLRLTAEMVVLSGCGTGLNAVLGSDELDPRFGLADQGVSIAHPADDLHRSVQRVAVMEVDRGEHFLEQRGRPARREVSGPEAGERDAPHRHRLLERVDRVATVVPQVSERLGRARRTGVVVGKEDHARLARIAHELVQGPPLRIALAQVRVQVRDREAIPAADADRVRSTEVERVVAPLRMNIELGRGNVAAALEIAGADASIHFVRFPAIPPEATSPEVDG